jgi:hypothetical protein
MDQRFLCCQSSILEWSFALDLQSTFYRGRIFLSNMKLFSFLLILFPLSHQLLVIFSADFDDTHAFCVSDEHAYRCSPAYQPDQ